MGSIIKPRIKQQKRGRSFLMPGNHLPPTTNRSLCRFGSRRSCLGAQGGPISSSILLLLAGRYHQMCGGETRVVELLHSRRSWRDQRKPFCPNDRPAVVWRLIIRNLGSFCFYMVGSYFYLLVSSSLFFVSKNQRHSNCSFNVALVIFISVRILSTSIIFFFCVNVHF